MAAFDETLRLLENDAAIRIFAEMYGENAVAANIERYKTITGKFAEKFGSGEIELFSSPGRAELGGNHTDHNNGIVLAACIGMDIACAAGKNGDRMIRLYESGTDVYSGEEITVDINDSYARDWEKGSAALVKGIVAAFQKSGYKIGGFNAVVSSILPPGAGISSSAAFEMLICSVLNEFYNNGAIDITELAKIGRYAENVYWGKASGLLDQMACTSGGIVSVDFKNPSEPAVEKINFSFDKYGYSLIIVNTGGAVGHSALSAEYSAIAREMKTAAAFFGKKSLREVSKRQIIGNIADLREKTGDRAILRALHFFDENERAALQADALKRSDLAEFLVYVAESGNSSWRLLQNCYLPSGTGEQPVALALVLTECFLKSRGGGACRVHGGGFAGSILVVLPSENTDEFIGFIEKRMTGSTAIKVSVRKRGTLCITTELSGAGKPL